MIGWKSQSPGTAPQRFRISEKNRQQGPPTRTPPVNFANLSTGENGDFEAESLAPNTDPGGLCWTPLMHLSERRPRAHQIPAKCLGYGRGPNALVSSETTVRAGPTGRWLPRISVSNWFLRGHKVSQRWLPPARTDFEPEKASWRFIRRVERTLTQTLARAFMVVG